MRWKNTKKKNDKKRGNNRMEREKEEKQNLRRGRQFSGANNVSAEATTMRKARPSFWS